MQEKEELVQIKDENPIWDPEHLRKIEGHPCYSPQARHLYGRLHLPVAPSCNVKCNFCLRRFDCVNESRPGVTSKILTPTEALERTREVISKFPQIKVVGIAGPGDPLDNLETFETLELIKKEFPYLKLCLSTNGLLLPQKVDLLEKLGVATITVTLNAINPHIGKEIYAFIRHDGKYLYELEGAEFLLAHQLEGIKKAASKGVMVKINSVMIPGINDHHLIDIAMKAKELGAFIMNIMPLIPQDKFSHLRPPTREEREKIQEECGHIIGQMKHCRQCRADAVGMLDKDLSLQEFTVKTCSS